MFYTSDPKASFVVGTESLSHALSNELQMSHTPACGMEGLQFGVLVKLGTILPFWGGKGNPYQPP